MITADEALAVAERVAQLAAGLPVEVTCVVPQVRSRWSDTIIVNIGQPDHVLAQPRDVLRAVLTSGGDAFVLAHTHVSLDAPGEQDLAVTRRLVAAAAVVGLPLLAHVVVGPAATWECLSGRTWQ